MPNIDAEMSVAELVAAYPQLEQLLKQYGFDPTVQKSLAYESVMASCLVHQVSLDTLLEDLENVLDVSPSSQPN
jgi:hypothetical protein